MKKLIIFNWKMAPDSLKETILLFKQTQIYANRTQINTDIIVAPPFVYLSEIAGLIKRTKVKLAAQDVFWENQGYYTGEISAKMLKNLGVGYVITGHSERRRYLGETDEMINKKVKATLNAGLKVVLCVGEDLRVRRRGKKAVEKFIKNQLEKCLKQIQNSKFKIQNSLIVAYEPIWAIGTGKACPPENAVEMIKFIKRFLSIKYQASNIRVLYGGSVSGKNIKNFVEYKEIDGVLVGGASLKKDEVCNIIKALNYER